jgi:cysteine-rich repeat protein
VHSRALSISRILAACLLVPAAASATFHEVKIVEVFPGTVAQPNAQYVVLQAWAGSQNFVDNHSLFFFDHTGAGAGSFTFDHNMANGANQMKMFVATAEASALFGSLGADLVMTPSIDPLGGKVCWDVNNFDCMAWGNYAGSSTGVGTPFNTPVGLELGRAALRRLDICMGPTTLDSCDDTNDSDADFVMGLPAPKNNAGTSGTLPSSSCGNSAVEGLETCDDGNAAGGDGCSAACRWEPDKVVPTAISVDGASGAQFFNGILEPGEGVPIDTTWQNLGASQIALTGTGALFTGPAGATYTITDADGDYGAVDPNAFANCQTIPCYVLSVSAPATRPAQHWDTTFSEVLSTYSFANWTLHVGDSFPDVPDDNIFYKFVENLFHNGVTGGCSGGNYCPTNPVTRAQMAVFLLKAKNGSGYTPPACTGTVFTDVPCTGGPFDPWIEDLAAQQITGGCGNNMYCPDATVTRKQMAVFLLKSFEGSTYDPPDCTGVFADVPCTPGTGFSDWIEELYNRQVTGGCSASPLNYCPDNPNNRGQMAVFLVKTFGLLLYAPPI